MRICQAPAAPLCRSVKYHCLPGRSSALHQGTLQERYEFLQIVCSRSIPAETTPYLLMQEAVWRIIGTAGYVQQYRENCQLGLSQALSRSTEGSSQFFSHQSLVGLSVHPRSRADITCQFRENRCEIYYPIAPLPRRPLPMEAVACPGPHSDRYT